MKQTITHDEQVPVKSIKVSGCTEHWKMPGSSSNLSTVCFGLKSSSSSLFEMILVSFQFDKKIRLLACVFHIYSSQLAVCKFAGMTLCKIIQLQYLQSGCMGVCVCVCSRVCLFNSWGRDAAIFPAGTKQNKTNNSNCLQLCLLFTRYNMFFLTHHHKNMLFSH